MLTFVALQQKNRSNVLYDLLISLEIVMDITSYYLCTWEAHEWHAKKSSEQNEEGNDRVVRNCKYPDERHAHSHGINVEWLAKTEK